MEQYASEFKKLNIAMICDPIGDYKAGSIVSAVRFANLLHERGHNVIFIGSKTPEHRAHNEFQGMKAYRYRSIPLPRSGGWRLAFPTIREIKEVLREENIDVVHVILPMSCALMAIKAAKSLDIKIVAHSHSQPENLFMDAPRLSRPMLDRMWNAYLAWIYSKAESIIYPSEMAFGLLDHLTAEGKPSTVISNGVNIDRYKPVDVGDFHKRFNIPTDTVNLFYVGRLFPEKSLDTLVKAVPSIIGGHPKTHVIIAGHGYMLPKLQKLAERLDVGAFVTFISPISDEDKIIAYSISDMFVSPSFAELEGMTVLEAMACGKPVIIPNAEMNAARHFVDGNGLLFETANAEDLAKQALRLIADVDLRRKMGEVSLSKSKNYDIHRSVERLEHVYHSALQ